MARRLLTSRRTRSNRFAPNKSRSMKCRKLLVVSVLLLFGAVAFCTRIWMMETRQFVVSQPKDLPSVTSSSSSKQKSALTWLPPSSYSYAYTNSPPCADSSQTPPHECTIRIPYPFPEPDTAAESIECDSYCLVTRHGQKPGPNQDRSLAIAIDANTTKPARLLAALFDGHGADGEKVSQFASYRLPSRLLEQWYSNNTTSDAPSLVSADSFVQLDDWIIAQTEFMGGSTALLMLATESTVQWISIGDSTGFLVEWPSGQIVSSVPAHKPSDPIERQRIEANGGVVLMPPDPKFSSRAQYEEQMPGNPNIIGSVSLAMSRSLGDRGGKVDPRTGERRRLIIAKPWTGNVALEKEQQYFAVLATDGLMDMVPKERVVAALGNALYDAGSPSLGQVCTQLIHEASETWKEQTMKTYRDDITLTVYKIR